MWTVLSLDRRHQACTDLICQTSNSKRKLKEYYPHQSADSKNSAYPQLQVTHPQTAHHASHLGIY